jgi:non-canonical poly(A) RNA polymerase PAPD5/7
LQQTLNNRLLIQEVYDQRLLHKLLGTSPKPRIVVANVLETAAQDKSSMAASSITRTRERSVDMLLETDDESLPQQPSGSRQDNDELSRYHIEKRRVVQRHEASRSDEQPEFTTDEDDSVDEEEASYQMGLDDGASVNEMRSMTSKRRSFWLSKGIGPESADDSN